MNLIGKAFHRSGTRNETRSVTKGSTVFGYTERRLGRPYKQEHIMRKSIHVYRMGEYVKGTVEK